MMERSLNNSVLVNFLRSSIYSFVYQYPKISLYTTFDIINLNDTSKIFVFYLHINTIKLKGFVASIFALCRIVLLVFGESKLLGFPRRGVI